jgi:hypothetical protein
VAILFASPRATYIWLDQGSPNSSGTEGGHFSFGGEFGAIQQPDDGRAEQIASKTEDNSGS